MSTVVVGGGVFGVTAAIALAHRKHSVTLIDPGPLPHPLAESTDISKVVRMDYGADEVYTALMESALDGWRRWNRAWPEPLFHETGVTFLTRAAMTEGFEYDSYTLLSRRGHPLNRLDAAAIHARFPAWRPGAFTDGYFNPTGGYARAARVVERLLAEATRAGVTLQGGRTFARLEEKGGRVTGLTDTDGHSLTANNILLAAGSWVPHALPRLAPHLRSVGQPVFHLQPPDPSLFTPDRFPVFGADISRTGYYGFPLTDGIVKISNHGVGWPVDPSSTEGRVTSAAQEESLRAFLADTFPSLAAAPIVYRRVCVYCDTWDEHFWIARDPEMEGLTVATGGMGHAFKFAPVLGDLIADAVEGVENAALHKFRWRPEIRPERGEEAARHHGNE